MNLENVKEMVLNNLKEVVKHEGDFMPVVFVEGKKPAVMGCPFTDKTKVPIFMAIGNAARDFEATTLYVVTDSYIRIIDATKEDAKWIQKNWDIEKPSMYPESMRQSCLAISQINLDGSEGQLYTISYRVSEEKEIVITEEKVMGGGEGLVKDSILKGYKGMKDPRVQVIRQEEDNEF